MKFKKTIISAMIMASCFAVGCGSSSGTSSSSDEVVSSTTHQTIKLSEMGLEYSTPLKWDTDENVNILQESVTTPENAIYSFLEYLYYPDEHSEEMNDPDSMVSIYDLSAPVFVFFVIDANNLDHPSVELSMSYYDTIHELGQEGDYKFYFLTDYNLGTEFFSEEAQSKYEEIVKEGYEVLETAKISKPDVQSASARIAEGLRYITYETETIFGTYMNSIEFANSDVTVLNFYGTYAYPNINEMKELEKFYQEIRRNYPNVTFMQVLIDTPDEEAEALAREFYAKEDVTFEGLIPDGYLNNWIVNHLVGLPTTVFVSNTGRVHDIVIEGVQKSEYYIEKLDLVLEDLLGAEGEEEIEELETEEVEIEETEEISE